MKKIIISGFFIAAFALVATIFYNNASKPVSDLAKANIMALAANEVNTGDDDAFNPFDGSGTGGSGSGGMNWYDAYTTTWENYPDGQWKNKKSSNGSCESMRMYNPTKNGFCWIKSN